jgi:hypothetical protein
VAGAGRADRSCRTALAAVAEVSLRVRFPSRRHLREVCHRPVNQIVIRPSVSQACDSLSKETFLFTIVRESIGFECHPLADAANRRGEGKSRSMIHAIRDTLPIITAVMISPIPVAGLIVVLTSKRGPVKSVAYGMGFFVALWLPTFLLAWTGKQTIAVSGASGASSTWGVLIHGVMGAILLVVAVVAFRKHLRRPSPAMEPRWMKTLDSTPMLMVFALGGVIVLNPKNVPLLISAAVDYAQASLSTVQLAIVVTVFAALGSLLIFLPIVLVHLAPEFSARVFGTIRAWFVAHNAIVLAAICLVAGVVMLGGALFAAF